MNMLNKTFVASAIAAMGMAYAGSAAATSFPSGDWTAKGVLTVTNSASPPGVFTCAVTIFGRAHGLPGTANGGGGTGYITGIRVQNTHQAGQPLPGQACGGIPIDENNSIPGVTAKFNNVDGRVWPYAITGIAPNKIITVSNVWFGVADALMQPGCGLRKAMMSGANDGQLVMNWTDGDPTFADGDVTWSVISGPGTVTTTQSPGAGDCAIEGSLRLFFKVGHEAIAKP